jgi:hypothetical protein
MSDSQHLFSNILSELIHVVEIIMHLSMCLSARRVVVLNAVFFAGGTLADADSYCQRVFADAR